MCTASWLTRDDALLFFFNRDELRAREPALPPTVRADRGVRWAAPTDGRAGGTWIGATAHGLVLALLNRSEGPRPTDATSRGELVPRLVDAPDPEVLVRRLTGPGLDRFPPFRLLALWRHLEDGLCFGWDGHRVELDPLDPERGLVCSSGLGDERAGAARGAVWEEMSREASEIDPELHRRFHRDHRPEPSAWSVCVHRPEAATLSYTEVELGPDRVVMRYHAASPCQAAAGQRIELDAAPPLARED